ncbi:hypothetical protein T440DRAFT_473679 [Plenodomus tracheiphilus IPT5]|uniref:Uncharacterized protein n=1 Tax=Plenodomus tracheiphilus IPT5 TaxID=1408161 RepID=A0A6A7AP67_9PLEO|nr:hypothetical protein T440DRAFT_473801 [Plenodomus tracheiphilus IPT5]KAF2844078.1 hypothetical protein T440DRAFT_473679 [Plenodomus tracheiphilus IPT5]
MKVFQTLAITLLSPTIVSAWLCNCYQVSNPDLKASGHFCDPKGGAYCYDHKLGVQACILNTPINDIDCANSYKKVVNGKLVPDPSWRAECEHYTGKCPKTG